MTTEDFIQNELQEIKKIIKKAKEDQRKRQDLGMIFVMGTGPRGAFIWTVVLMSFNIAGSAHVIW